MAARRDGRHSASRVCADNPAISVTGIDTLFKRVGIGSIARLADREPVVDLSVAIVVEAVARLRRRLARHALLQDTVEALRDRALAGAHAAAERPAVDVGKLTLTADTGCL